MDLTGRAHGKCILIGEHAVVHGTHAIAMPVALTLEVSLGLTGSETLHPRFRTWFASLALAHCGQPWLPAVIQGNLPRGAGLGSSAALAVASLRALAKYKSIAPEQLLTWADESERLFHGNPSGIDVRAVLSDTAILFCRGDGAPTVQVLPSFPGTWHFQLWITPAGEPTASVVARVSSSLDSHGRTAELRRAEEIITMTMHAASRGEQELVGRKMLAFQRWLAKHGASTPLLDHLVDLAISHGALGAKLTGGGGGGALLVLAPNSSWQRPTLPAGVLAYEFVLPAQSVIC